MILVLSGYRYIYQQDLHYLASYMLSYIAKRLLLSAPTLLIVSALAFGLSQMAGGDPTASYLRLQGIEEGQSNYLQSYEQQYRKAGLHKPAFYISMRPNYAKVSVSTYSNPIQRSFLRSLVDQRYSSSWAIELLEEIEQAAKTNNDMALTAERWLAQGDLSMIEREAAEIGLTPISLLASEASRNNLHYPVLRWHGTDCRYHEWLMRSITGEFGISKLDGQPASTKIWSALRWTLLILLINIVITLCLSVPYGLYTGMHVGSRADRWSGMALFAVFAMPTFWIATMLVMLFTTSEYGMKIFPSVGTWYGGRGQSFLEMIGSKWTLLMLPIGILVVKDVAYLGRMIRDTVAKEITKQYALTARAKGLTERQLAIRHVLPNALGPAITLAVGAIPASLGGTLLLEVIFNIPGMGRLLYSSITQADWAVVYPIVLLTAVVTIVFYLVGDILIAWLNPKVTL